MNEMGMSQYWFAFLRRNFNIASVYLSYVEKKQDDWWVGLNEELDVNSLPSELIDRHQNY